MGILEEDKSKLCGERASKYKINLRTLHFARAKISSRKSIITTVGTPLCTRLCSYSSRLIIRSPFGKASLILSLIMWNFSRIAHFLFSTRPNTFGCSVFTCALYANNVILQERPYSAGQTTVGIVWQHAYIWAMYACTVNGAFWANG